MRISALPGVTCKEKAELLWNLLRNLCAENTCLWERFELYCTEREKNQNISEADTKGRRIMASKTDTEVIIDGKVFTLSGYESEEYLQKVASYINNKISEYNKIDSFRRQPMDTQAVLLQLNIADDYFKAKKHIADLEEDLQTKEKEYDLKHELISAQIKLENSEEQVKTLQQERGDDAKKIVQLETELKKK